jgi:hypothetical protein
MLSLFFYLASGEDDVADDVGSYPNLLWEFLILSLVLSSVLLPPTSTPSCRHHGNTTALAVVGNRINLLK